MTSTQVRIVAVGPLVTLQDSGRPGWSRYGIPTSGPMDRFAHAAANVLCGQPASSTAIEVSAGTVTFEADATVTIGYAGAEIETTGLPVVSGTGVLTVPRGRRVFVRPADTNWAYIAFSGGIDAPRWLGSSATHAFANLGGGIVQPGHQLALGRNVARPERDGIVEFPDETDAPLAVVLGPQQSAFADEAIERLVSESFIVTSDLDRMGARLQGPLLPQRALTIASEPVVRGSVQVDGSFQPVVLMADHQPTGGYPKIATVVSVATDILARRVPGSRISFRALTAEEAIRHVRATNARRCHFLEALADPHRTLAQRLGSKNLDTGWGPSI